MSETVKRRVEQGQPAGRHLSATAIRSGQTGAMLLQQARSEFLKLWRIPMFSVPTLLFPILLFLLLVGVAVVGLLMVVMRALLRQAAGLRADMEAVI